MEVLMPRPEMGIGMINQCAIIRSKLLFLIRRSEKNSQGVGKWELAGGKIEDEFNIKEEALREVFEETGFTVKLVKHLGWRFSKDISGKRFKATPNMALYWIARIVKGSMKLSEEHDMAGWFTYKQALALGDDLSDRTRDFLVKYKSALKEFGLQMD